MEKEGKRKSNDNDNDNAIVTTINNYTRVF